MSVVLQNTADEHSAAAQTKAVDRDNNASLDAANLSSSNNENNSDSLLRVDALKMKK